MLFEEIRPYNDDEVKRVWKELLTTPILDAIFSRLDIPVLPEFHTIENSADLQNTVMRKVFKRICDISIDHLTVSGIEVIAEENDRGFLFISNHRDIVLDPALTIYAIDTHQYKSVQIAVGDNLLTSPLVKDLIRINNCFVVKRNLPKKEQLEASVELSAYIWQQNQKGKHIWIAQREGRAKEGNDFTNSALISMLYLSERARTPLSDFINRLNIVPVSISYEYDPCDELKAKELLIKKQNNNRYAKEINEDVNSIIKGIFGHKGRVHFTFSPPLKGDFLEVKAVTQELDRQIITNYKLWPTNLTAYDELYHTNSDVPPDDRKKFLDRLNRAPGELRPFMLQMYANPVKNKYGYLES